MKTRLETIEYELAGVEENIKKIGKPRFYQFKNKRALNYWECVRFDILRSMDSEMSREIKFREWETERKTMVYGTREDYDDSVGFRFEHEEGGERILMQYTGINDKNGVEIYVGDIVIFTSKSIKYADIYWHSYAEVFQHPNGAYRLRGKEIYEMELYGNRKQVMLNGNIYETPELLENDRFCTETDDPDY